MSNVTGYWKRKQTKTQGIEIQWAKNAYCFFDKFGRPKKVVYKQHINVTNEC